MASTDKIALLELIRKIGLEDGDVDFLREGLKVLAEAVMNAEVSQIIGAQRFERSSERELDFGVVNFLGCQGTLTWPTFMLANTMPSAALTRKNKGSIVRHFGIPS